MYNNKFDFVSAMRILNKNHDLFVALNTQKFGNNSNLIKEIHAFSPL